MFLPSYPSSLLFADDIEVRDQTAKSCSLFFHSARIALNYDPAIVVTPSVTRETSRQYCTTSAQDILFLIRTYRLKYGLQYSPLVLVYAAVQAIRAINALGISEEYGYLLQSLGECAETWSLASQVPLGG